MDSAKISLSQRIKENASKFTQSDQLIADYLMSEYPNSLLQNASEISAAVNVDVSTVTRFFPKIGYNSIKNAHMNFREEFKFSMNSPLDRVLDIKNQNDKVFEKVLKLDLENIQKTYQGLDLDRMEAAVHMLGDKKRQVFILGFRKEFSLAYYTYHQLMGFKDNIFLLRGSNLIDFLARMKTRDVLLVFDFRRYAAVHVKACQYAKSIDCHVITIADSPMAPSAPHSDNHLIVTTKGASAYDSYTAAMSLINILQALLLEYYGVCFKKKYTALEDLFVRFDMFLHQQKSKGSKK